MSLIVKQENDFDFQICPQGNHVAVCFSVIDLGVQEVNFQGTVSHKRKVRVSWELPNEMICEGELAGQPFSISKNYTMSLHPKSVLYKDLISWRGRQFSVDELSGFDLKNIIGAPCMLNVIHQESQDGQKTYANVSGISQLPKGMSVGKPINATRFFNTEDFSPQQLEALPEWLQEKINIPSKQAMADAEYQNSLPPQGNYNFHDDIPFS